MPSPAQQRTAPLQASIETILDDRLCSHCGYNLKGLDATGLCPECGESCSGGVSSLGHRVIDNTEIGQSSLAYLLPLGLALFMCGLSGLALAWFSHVTLMRSADSVQVRIGLAAASAWFLAILILLRDRPTPKGGLAGDVDEAAWPLKLAVALTQPAWIAVAALSHLELSGVAWASGAKWAAFAVGALGLPAVPWLLSYTALWSVSLGLAGWLRGAAWALALGGPVFGTIQTLWALNLKWAFLFQFPEGIARFIWLLGFACTALFSLQLVVDARWAIINARERAARDRRIAARHLRYAQAAPKLAPIELAPIAPEIVARLEDSAVAALSPPEPPENYIHYHDDARMEPGKDVKPYPLEDTAPPADPTP